MQAELDRLNDIAPEPEPEPAFELKPEFEPEPEAESESGPEPPAFEVECDTPVLGTLPTPKTQPTGSLGGAGITNVVDAVQKAAFRGGRPERVFRYIMGGLMPWHTLPGDVQVALVKGTVQRLGDADRVGRWIKFLEGMNYPMSTERVSKILRLAFAFEALSEAVG